MIRRLPCCSLLIILSLGFVRIADSRTFVLRPDGTGDVPTFQAGVDQLLADPGCVGNDTLFVMPGTYDEDVRIDLLSEGECQIHAVVLAPEGMDQTRVRSITVVSEVHNVFRLLLWDGLTVLDEVAMGNSQSWCKWARCRFAGGFRSTLSRTAGAASPPFLACEFRRFAVLQGYIGLGDVRDCRFCSASVQADGTEHGLTFRGCVFEGPADAAVFADTGGYGDDLTFVNCEFRHVQNGIVVRPDRPLSYLILDHCRFEDVAGNAVGHFSTLTGQGFFSWVLVSDCSFVRCGVGLNLKGVSRQLIGLARDTFVDCAGPAFDVQVSRLLATGLQVSGSKGAGARFELVQDMQTFSLTDSRFADNAGTGLELAGALFGEEPETPSIDHCLFENNGGSGLASTIPVIGMMNTSVLNQGNGFVFATSSASIRFESSIAAGNAGSGFLVGPGVAAQLSHNDAWMNEGASYSGTFDGTDNLTVDPQFCDPLAGDFHVTSASPCAPTGVLGQIGAFGVGCEVMTVAVDAVPRAPHSINTSSNAPFQIAILGHRLFDSERIDLASVRADGVTPAPPGGSKKSSRIADLNHDGRADLLMTFDGQALNLADGQVTVEGHMIDGSLFRGSDAVEIASTLFTESLTPVATELSLIVPSPQRAAEAALTVSSRARAKIEVFDISGRRVMERNLEPRAGQNIRLGSLNAMRSGIYMVRLTQHDAMVARRLVLTR